MYYIYNGEEKKKDKLGRLLGQMLPLFLCVYSPPLCTLSTHLVFQSLFYSLPLR